MAVIRQAGHSCTYQSSREKDWHRVLEEPSDLVAVAGGDGALGKVAKRLIGQDTALAILPLGTANNIFKSLCPPSEIEDLIAGWKTARPRNCDVGSVNGFSGESYFIESFGVGLLARLISDSDGGHSMTADPATQPNTFFRQAAELCRAYPTRRIKVALDGRDLSGEYFLLEAMNTKFIGSNLCLAPKAEPDDHVLDLVLLSSDDRDKFVTYLAAHAKDPLQPAPFQPHQGRRLRLEIEGSDLHIDDHVLRDELSASCMADVNVKESAINFLVPAMDR